MQRFKAKSFIPVLLSLSLGACTLPKTEKKSSQDDSATFFISKTESKFVNTQLSDSYSIPKSKTLSIKSCLKDIQYSKEVIGHSFNIEGTETGQTLKTNEAGCLTWKEEIAYNHLTSATYVTFERTIIAQGVQKGRRTIQLAINPWENVSYDLKETKVPQLVPADQARIKLFETTDKNPLSLQDLRVVIDEKQLKQGEQTLHVEIRTEPKLLLKNSAGELVPVPLSKGTFQGQIYLLHSIAENEKDKKRILSQSPVLPQQHIIDNQIFFETDLKLENICTRGQLQLGFKLIPIHAPAGLKTFEGVYHLAECDRLKGSHFSRLKNGAVLAQNEKTPFSIENYAQTLNTEDLQNKEAYQSARIEILPLNIRHVRFTNGKTIEKDRVLNIEICLRNGMDHNQIRAHDLKINRIQGDQVSIRTNDLGCANWDDLVTFNQFAPECWISKTIQVEIASLSLNQKLDLQINPWAQNESFARDLRFTKQGAELKTCTDGKPELLVNRYDFDKLDYHYDIDPGLFLTVKKRGIFKVSMRLKRPSLTDPSGFSEENAPVGQYLLKYAVVDMAIHDYTKASGHIYAAGEKVVTVHGNSTLSEELTLATKNIKAIGNTNQLIFEISPLSSGSLLSTSTFRAPLTMANNMEGGNVEILKQEGITDKLIQQFAIDEKNNLLQNEKLMSKSLLAQENNLDIINLNNPLEINPLLDGLTNPTAWRNSFSLMKPTEVPLSSLSDWVNKGITTKELSQKFCDYWIQHRLQKPLPGKPYGLLSYHGVEASFLVSECRRLTKEEPRKFFDLEFRYFVKNTKLVGVADGHIRDFMINQAFSLSKGYSINHSKAWAWDISAGLKLPEIPLLPIFSASSGVRYNVTRAETDSSSWGNSMSFTSGVNMTVETISLKMQAPQYEKCAVIKLNPHLYIGNTRLVRALDRRLGKEEINAQLRRGLMICQGEVQNQAINFTENYYVLNQKTNPTQMLDNAADANRPFFMTLRGRADYISFINYLQRQFDVPQSFEVDYQQSHLLYDPTQAAFARGIRSYPGQIVAPR
ncbi:MAG: hypothetical protein BroJett040_24010 [Oligoflexia bacterium]|nr:MAG: hypothetical protein BroJett040_24010 [Oligoflexia bacterium]